MRKSDAKKAGITQKQAKVFGLDCGANSTVNVKAMLAGRAKRYGSFAGHSAIAQELKDAMRKTPGWGRLTPSQKESLEMQQHKIARVLNGDPAYLDNWVDLVGYSQLVVDELEAAAHVAPKP